MDSPIKVIRFCVIYSQANLTLWQYNALQTILAQPNTSLELLLCLEAPEPVLSATKSGSRHIWNAYRRWLYAPAQLRPAPLPQEWASRVRPVRCRVPAAAGAPLELEDAALELLQERELDFILSFTDLPVGGQLQQLTRQGVWAFRFGVAQAPHLQPVGVREIRRHELTTTASLCQYAADAEEQVLRQGVFRTLLHSPSQTADTIYLECANWPADICQQLRAGYSPVPQRLAPLPAPPPPWLPANPDMLGFLAQLVKNKVQHLYHRFLRADQWNIGVVNRPIKDFLQPNGLHGALVEAPPLPSRNVFYADCFARQEAAGTVIYFELYDYQVRRGNISRLHYPWQPGSTPVPVIDFPFHLSYPFLFGHYCLPEAWITNGVRLYDLRQPITDPGAGVVLLEAPAVDATLLEYQGRYWLFYTRMDRDPMLNLFISYADALDGPWQAHPRNPVRTDIRSARPAGPFFEEDGKLYRPAQDCALDYGHGITINEVVTLTPTDYEERTVTTLTSPHPGFPDGMHTVTAIDDTHTLIDFKRYRFIPLATLMALWAPVSGMIYGKKGRRKRPVIKPHAAVQPLSVVDSTP